MLEIIPNYHPILVHFTIALITTSVGTFILDCLLPRWETIQQECYIVSRWCLWLGALVSILTIGTGFYAYYTVAHDEVSHQVMTIHRNWALSTFGLIWIMAIWSWSLWFKNHHPKWLYGVGLIVTFGFVTITGWYGAELVYHYGIGVKSLPQAEKIGHKHTHINPHQAHDQHDNHF